MCVFMSDITDMHVSVLHTQHFSSTQRLAPSLSHFMRAPECTFQSIVAIIRIMVAKFLLLFSALSGPSAYFIPSAVPYMRYT